MNSSRAFGVFLCVIAAGAFGEISFSVTADKTGTMPGEPIQITATIVSTKNLGNIGIPTLPKNDAFDVVRSSQNQSSSSSIQIINGTTTKKDEITYYFYYTITCKQIGAFTFPALAISLDNKTYASQPFTITVQKEPPARAQEVLVRLSLSKKQLYAGEQCNCTVRIGQKPGTPVQLTNEGFGAFIQNLEKNLAKDFAVVGLSGGKATRKNEQMDGELYTVFSVSYALFPLKAGAISVPAIPLEYTVLRREQQRRLDPFDDFFGGSFFGNTVSAIPRTALSNAVSCNVKDLPPQPADFSGAVGRFSLSAGVDPTQVAAGEAVTLKITVSGNTRPGSLSDIRLTQPADCEVFTPEKHTGVDTTLSGIVSKKSYKYLIVPRKEGGVTLAPVSWTYFDPEAQQYKTLHSETFTITVTKGTSTAAQTTRYLTQRDIQEVGRDIRYIKTPRVLQSQIDRPYKRPVFYFLFPLPFCLALFSFLYKIQSQRTDVDMARIVRRKALATAFKKTDSLAKKSDGGPAMTDFLAAISDILEQYISQKFGFSAVGKTLDELKLELTKYGVSEHALTQLDATMTALDSYRFGGGDLSGSLKNDVLQKVKNLISSIETTPKKGI